MLASQFYNARHTGMLFGARYKDMAGRIQTHRGHDLNGFAAGEDIPSIFPGRAVAKSRDSGYGEFLTVQMGPKLFGHYCHMEGRSPVALGEQLAAGAPDVGEIGNTGAFAIGYHLHLMVTTTSSLRGPAVDPLPFIRAALEAASNPTGEPMLYIKATTAGSGGAAAKGFIYRQVEGSWMGITNLEGDVIVPVLKASGAVVVEFAGDDLELLFATDGVWEQASLDGTVTWGSEHTALQGLGARSGRRKFLGSPGALGQWHYPAQLGAATATSVEPDLTAPEFVKALAKAVNDDAARRLAS